MVSRLFQPRGYLNDGQHQLLGIKSTGIPAEIDVRFGVPRDAFHVTGFGKRRSAAQVLGIEGYSNATCQASIARLIRAYDAGQMEHFDPADAAVLASRW